MAAPSVAWSVEVSAPSAATSNEFYIDGTTWSAGDICLIWVATDGDNSFASVPAYIDNDDDNVYDAGEPNWVVVGQQSNGTACFGGLLYRRMTGAEAVGLHALRIEWSENETAYIVVMKISGQTHEWPIVLGNFTYATSSSLVGSISGRTLKEARDILDLQCFAWDHNDTYSSGPSDGTIVQSGNSGTGSGDCGGVVSYATATGATSVDQTTLYISAIEEYVGLEFWVLGDLSPIVAESFSLASSSTWSGSTLGIVDSNVKSQSFWSGESCNIEKILIYMGAEGSPNDQVMLTISVAMGGTAVRTAYATVTTPDWYEFTFSPYSVTAGTTRWINLYRTSPYGDSNNYYKIYYTLPMPPVFDSQAYVPSTWTSTNHFMFQVRKSTGGTTYTKTYNLDSLKRKTSTIDFLINSLQSLRFELSSLAQVFIKQISTNTHSVQSALSATLTRTHDVLSLLSKTSSITHSVESLHSATFQTVHDILSLVMQQQSLSHSVESLQSKTQSLSFDVNALLSVTTTTSSDVESLSKKTFTSIHDIQILAAKTQTSSSNVDVRKAVTEVTYDSSQSAHGGTSARIAAAPNTTAYLEYSDFGTQSKIYTRQYVYLSGQLSNLTRPFTIVALKLGGNDLYVSLNQDGTFNLMGDSGITGGSIPFNQWFRVELEADCAANTTTAKIFYTKDSTAADVTLTRPWTITETFDTVRFGISYPNATYEAPGYPTQLWIDDVAIDFTDWIGRWGILSHGVDTLAFVRNYTSNDVMSLLQKTAKTSHDVDAELSSGSQTYTKSHDVESLALKSASLTSDAEAFLKKTSVVTNDVDALVKKPTTIAHDVQALTQTTSTVESEVDALASKPSTAAHLLEANILKAQISAHDVLVCQAARTALSGIVEALLRRTGALPYSVDVELQIRAATTHDVEAFTSTYVTLQHGVQGLLRKEISDATSIEALILQTQTTWSLIDSLTKKEQTSSHDLDTLTKSTSTKESAVDALLLNNKAVAHSAEAIILKTGFQTQDVVAWAASRTSIAHSVEVLTKATSTVTHSVDAEIVSLVTATKISDVESLLRKTLQTSSEVETQTKIVPTISQSVDILALSRSTTSSDIEAFARTTTSLSADVNALTLKEQRTSHYVDALICRTSVVTNDVQTYTSKTTLVQHMVESVLHKTLTTSSDVDTTTVTGKVVTHLVDALLHKQQTVAHEVQSYSIYKLQSTADVDALLVKTGTPASSVDAVVYQTVVLLPISDVSNQGWRDEFGETSNIYDSINDGVDE